MSLTLSIALYFVIWWTVLFAVLPLWVRTQAEEGVVVPGTEQSAPARPKFLRIVIVTTVLAAVVLACVQLVIAYKIIDIETIGPAIR
ncbi:MAG: DUF1467 family protein [Hyphomicrobiaceae bacterium]